MSTPPVNDGQKPIAAITAHPRGVIVVIVALAAIAAVLAWRYTSLSHFVSPAALAQQAAAFSSSNWAPLIVIGVFILGGLVAFPLTILIAATALLFASWLAFICALTGSIASAIVLYALGRFLLSRTLYRSFGALMSRIAAAAETRGIVAVAVLRTLPIAPYTLVNLAAGALRIRFSDYVIGTALGLLPGITVLTIFGTRLKAALQHPDAKNISLLAALIIVWIGTSLLLQRWSTRRHRSTHTHNP